MNNSNPIKIHLRLKQPCANCPFLKKGAIEIREGRLEGIINGLFEDDTSTFQCHKTVHTKNGGTFDDDGKYDTSGKEAMCAGAAAYLMKKENPTVLMRIAFLTGDAKENDWDDAKNSIID